MGISLINYQYRRAQPIVVGTTFGKMVQRCLRKQAEQAIRSKPISSILPWSLLQSIPLGPCLQFLPWIPLMMDCSVEKLWAEISPSFLKLLSFMVLCGSHRNPNWDSYPTEVVGRAWSLLPHQHRNVVLDKVTLNFSSQLPFLWKADLQGEERS